MIIYKITECIYLSLQRSVANQSFFSKHLDLQLHLTVNHIILKLCIIHLHCTLSFMWIYSLPCALRIVKSCIAYFSSNWYWAMFFAFSLSNMYGPNSQCFSVKCVVMHNQLNNKCLLEFAVVGLTCDYLIPFFRYYC